MKKALVVLYLAAVALSLVSLFVISGCGKNNTANGSGGTTFLPNVTL